MIKMTTNGNIAIADALNKATATLLENKTLETPRLDAEVLLCYVLNCERISLVINKDKLLSESDNALYLSFIERRKKNEPISYITGKREFMSLEFDVAQGILIPRPDTEILVEKIIDIYKGKKANILDLCTGSGAIAVSLAYYLNNSLVSAVDKYDICVETARKNAAKNHVKINVIKADVLNDFEFGDVDCIVSNPPYIETDTLTTLPSDVKDFEPMYALDGGADGLIFYRKITDFAAKKMNSGGILAYEIGYNQAHAVKEIIDHTICFKQVEIIKDLSGLDRVILAEKR